LKKKIETSPDGSSISVGGTLDLRYLRAGEHTLILPVPKEIIELVGFVVMQWGAFEQRVDALIAHVGHGMSFPLPDNWRRLSFKKRRKIFKTLMAKYTAQMFPNESRVFADISLQAADLYWRRNVVAHGYMDLRAVPDAASPTGHRATFHARGTQNGHDVEVSLDFDSLQKLRHDIAHLGGNLMAATYRMGGRVENGQQDLVVADIEFLSDAQHGSFQTVPIPNKSEPQGGSSRG